MGNPNHDPENGQFADGEGGGGKERLNYASAGARRGDAVPASAKTGDRTTDAALKDVAAIKREIEQFQKMKEAGAQELARRRAETAARPPGERLDYSSAGSRRK